jgi:perosamine synthetase
MSVSLSEFSVPHEPFLSSSFLSFRALRGPLTGPRKASGHYFFFWARNAIYHCLRFAKLGPGDEVLVPAYVCKVVPEAVLACGATVVFYGVDRDCQPDFSDLENRISARTRVLIAVHFFGFPQPIARLQQFCRQHSLFFIEDCCHVLRSDVDGAPLGTFGDASVFSFRKFYPLYDGGELILNLPKADLSIPWHRESALFTIRVAMDVIDQIIGRDNSLVLRLSYRLLRLLRQRLVRLFRSALASRTLRIQKTEAVFDLHLVNQPMSRVSRLVLAHSKASAIAAKRRANYLVLHRELSNIEEVRFLAPALQEGVCPWIFPLFFRDFPNACQALRSQGIPAVTWEGVRPTELQDGVFGDVEFLYKNLVFLPVHQNLSAQDLQTIVQAVKSIVLARTGRRVGCSFV